MRSTCFAVISNDSAKLCTLRDYIYKLYARSYESSDESFLGLDMDIREVERTCILFGNHIYGNGSALRYYCEKDNKLDLLENILYLEEAEDRCTVNRYNAYLSEKHAYFDPHNIRSFYNVDNLSTAVLLRIDRYFRLGLI